MKAEREQSLTKFRVTHPGAKQVYDALRIICRKCNGEATVSGASKSMRRSLLLPQEIVDCIVDYISHDPPTLFACTHLSYTWYIAARAHLYRTLMVLNVAGFKEVRDLRKMGTIHLVRKIVATREVHPLDFLSPKVLTRLSAFTHLQKLDFESPDFRDLTPQLCKGCDTLKSTIRTLGLRHPRGSTRSIVFFISLFSNLEDLILTNIADAEITDDPRVPVIEFSPPLTGRLSLSGIDNPDFTRDLASLQKGFGFRAVDVRFCRDIEEIIDSCAGTMERLVWRHFHGSEIEKLALLRLDFLRHVEVNFDSVFYAFPDDPFYKLISIIPSPQFETCLIVSYHHDLDRLKQTLRATRKSKNEFTTQTGETKPKRDVKIVLGLDIMEGGAEVSHSSVWAALHCAIANGGFDFLNSPPNLEIYSHVGSYREVATLKTRSGGTTLWGFRKGKGKTR